MDPWRQLARLATRQQGLVTLEQAEAAGLPARTVQGHVERHGWTRMYRSVYVLPGSIPAFPQQVMAALLATGPRSVASHHTAATLDRLWNARSRRVHILVPVDRRAPRLPGVVGHRSRTLKTVDVVNRDGLRRTSVPRTLCDIAGLVTDRELRELAAMSLQARRTTIERVQACSYRLGRHAGAGRLREVLAQLQGTFSDSGFERDAREWLCSEGLPPHHTLYPLRAEDDVIVELDIAYPQEMVAVECQGFPWHSLPSSMTTDNLRNNGIAAVGWATLRLDQEQFARRSPVFLRQLRALLDARRDVAASPGSALAIPARRPRSW